MRILFVTNPGLGHLLPLLPLAITARDADHEVAVGAGTSIGAVVKAAGLRLVPMGPPDIRSLAAGIPELQSVKGPDRPALMWPMVFAGILAESLAAGVLELARSWSPDLVVHEDSEQGSWIAAEHLGIPHVTVQATAWRVDLQRLAREPLNRLRAAHGLAPDPDLKLMYQYRYLTTRPPALLDPGSLLPATAEALRPMAMDDVAETSRPSWLDHATPGQRRLCVTLGTANADRLDLLQPTIAGLAQLDGDPEVVVTVGSQGDPSALGDLPPRFHVVRYVPMSRLLPTCDLAVFHGGSGTMLAALAAGVPLVIVPIAADQHDNAERCQSAGVAQVLSADGLTAESVREAAAEVLGDPSYRVAAATVRDQIAEMPPPAKVLADLERLVANGQN